MGLRIRTYTELKRLKTFSERYNYLKLNGRVGHSTFGHDRYINQLLYKSKPWLEVRDYVIIRDSGLDLAMDGHEIFDKIIIHHMNPISIEDIEDDNPDIYNPEYLICVSDTTHKAIHYGDESILTKPFIERRSNDTCPWKL